MMEFHQDLRQESLVQSNQQIDQSIECIVTTKKKVQLLIIIYLHFICAVITVYSEVKVPMSIAI
jgi:hypothetical protein